MVVAYGQFIPRALYSLPRFKTINVHFSLLPAYRGAAPVQRAIENGETRSGITIFEISGQMDAGDIWTQEEVIINPDDTCGSYQQRLGELAAPLLLETMEQIFSDKIRKHPQDDSLATLAQTGKKKRGPGRLELAGPASCQQAAGLHSLAGIVFQHGKPADQNHQCRHLQPVSPGPTGNILALDALGLKVACGQGSVLEITAIQPEGKKEMSPRQYSLGNRFPERLA